MEAIVNEKVELTQLIKQSGKTAATRPLDVCPSIRVAFANGHSDLMTPGPLQRWKINAPKMTGPVPLKCFKDRARRDAVSYPRFDNLQRSQVANETPYGAHESSITIVPPLKALRAGLYPLCFQLAHYLVPQLQKLRSFIAGPRNAEGFMKLLLP